MSDIAPIGTHPTTPPLAPSPPTAPIERIDPIQPVADRPVARTGAAGDAGRPAREADRAEFSEHARFMSMLRELPDVRTDLVERARADLAAGTLDAADRLDGALDALLDELEHGV